jgi:hypothetical protein
MRIGFLFNHDQIHQVAHSLPVALALANGNARAEIIIATTSAKLANEVVRLMGTDRPEAITVIALSLKTAVSRSLNAVIGKLIPMAKLMIYRDNIEFFKSLDALVVTERTSLILKTRYRLTKPVMILTDHGAGDRAIGFGASTALFDHILAAGPKIRDRLINEAHVQPDRLTITGYPKFDWRSPTDKPAKFSHSDWPIVLYNPHVSPHLSSWYKEGRAVLDYFIANPHYNLIFAPHIMMFERRVAITIDKLSIGLPGHIADKYRSAPNIHVDVDSVALTNMTYTNCADIYLGDVSSQVYEFLRTPRPCVFINSHHIDHEGDPNFAHWRAGPVITTAAQLTEALRDATMRHSQHYSTIQKALFDHTFDLTEEPSSVRAARAIAKMLGIQTGAPDVEHACLTA